MKQMQAKVSGVNKLQGFTDVYEVTLEVPDLFNSFVPNLAPVKISVGPELVARYKQLYITEEWFSIMLPG
jgi:hypothetical protein